jgi:hypothetical protein
VQGGGAQALVEQGVRIDNPEELRDSAHGRYYDQFKNILQLANETENPKEYFIAANQGGFLAQGSSARMNPVSLFRTNPEATS